MWSTSGSSFKVVTFREKKSVYLQPKTSYHLKTMLSQKDFQKLVTNLYPSLRSWQVFVDRTDSGKWIVDFRIKDVVQWKMYLVPVPNSKCIIRIMRYLSVDLFTDARHRNHHEVVFRNQWLGGGYCCGIMYESMNELWHDVTKLVMLTVDDSRQSLLQKDMGNPVPAENYSIDIDKLSMVEPPCLY